jgi:undecaprenyl-diphosphatase
MGQALLGIRVPGVGFEVALHLATLLSVALVFRARITQLARGALRLDPEAWRYLGLLVVATVPAAVVGLSLGELVESLFEIPQVTGVALLVTGTFLWTSRSAMGRSSELKPGLKQAILVGLAQCFALVPGISRSGATVVAGLWLGLEAEEAATFSFLMAIPAILGAAVLELPALAGGADGSFSGPLLAGSLVAAVTGVLAIRTFVIMLKKQSFHRFGPYCLTVGSLFLLYLLFVA